MKKLLITFCIVLAAALSWAGGTKLTKPPTVCAVASACFAKYQDINGDEHWVQTGSVACSGGECNVGSGYVICDGNKTDCA